MNTPNPFEEIVTRLSRIEHCLIELKDNSRDIQLQDEPDKRFTIDELCEYLPGKPAKSTIYGKVNKRTIPNEKMGGRLVFLRSAIDAWIASGKRKTQVELVEEAENKLIKNRRK